MTLCTLLILLLLLVCASAATSITAPPVLAEFQLPALIVGFTEYKPHESHQRFLAASLAAAGDGLQCIEWNVMKRKARIMRFPSDFALLQVWFKLWLLVLTLARLICVPCPQIHKISSSECDSMTPSALMERGVAAFSRVPGVAYVRVDSPVQVVPLSTDVQCDKTSWHDVSSSGSAECTWTPQSRADSLRPLVLRRGGTPGYGPDWLDVQNDALNDMNSGRDCVASVCSVPSLAWSGAGLGSERNGSGPGARCLCDGNLRSNHQDRGATSITDDFEADVVWNKGFTGPPLAVYPRADMSSDRACSAFIASLSCLLLPAHCFAED